MSQEEKDNIINLFKDSVPKTPTSNNVTGDGNIVGNGFVMINVYHKPSPSPKKGETKAKKGETSPFASEIRKLVEKLGVIEAYQYGGEGEARKKWYGAIKKRYGLDQKKQTYKDLDAEQAKNCIAYLKSMLPIKTRALKNSDEVYRKERYTAIYARARELGMSKGDVYVLFSNLFGKNIISLTKATNDEIEELYNYLMKRR